MLMGIMLGRTICGWLCPFGLFQDLLYKIKTPKIGKSAVTRVFSYLKYVILAVFVFLFSAVGLFPAFCKYICPAGILEGAFGLIPQNDWQMLSGLGAQFAWKFILLVTIIVACIFLYRGFCRFICPMGAIYSLFNKFSFFGIKLNKDKCTHCGKCISKCKLDIKHVGDHECISCGDCIDVCPTKAISWKGPKIFVAPNEIEVPEDADEEAILLAEQKQQEENEKARKKNKRTKIIIASIMATVLVSVLVYFNIIDNDKLWNRDDGNPPATDTSTDESKPPVGTEVGKSLPSYSLEKFDETGLLGENIDPSKTGKVTVINFWGTWCPSCIAELPYFDNVATQYKDNVVFVAVHAEDKFATEAADYVKEHFKDSNINFVKDTRESGKTSDTYYSLIGGKYNIYPYTVIIDANGVITYTKFAEISTNHGEIEGILTAEIEKALNK
jgi:thiol-disulfide isomerase/thioredoxin/ferredoxin